MKKISLTTVALLLALILALAGCGNNTSSSSSTSSSRPSSSSVPSSSSSPATTSPSSDSSVLDSSGNTLPGASDSANAESAATMSADFDKIGTLDAASQDWGPGGPRDEKNRSQSALAYNTKFGGYNALFISEDAPEVYLTFDEGYEFGLTPAFLDILRDKNVKALFFVTRDFAKAEPELVRRMIDEGHTIGNHSWTHKNYSTLSPAEAAGDMMKLHDYIKAEFGYEMTYFRFPSGNFNVQSLEVVRQMGYKSVFWSFAYKDWLTDSQPEPDAARERIISAACPGMIYLLHAVSQTNLDVLPEVIDAVRAAGYEWGDPTAL